MIDYHSIKDNLSFIACIISFFGLKSLSTYLFNASLPVAGKHFSKVKI